MSIIPTRGSGAAVRGATGTAARHLPSGPKATGPRGAAGRLGLGTMAGLGVLAGLSSAVVALIGQARSATRSIEAAAVEAALADGSLVPPSVPGGNAAQQRMADHLVHVRLPQGEGIYRPDGSVRPEDPATVDATDDVEDAGRPLTLVMLGDSTSVGYGTRTADELPGVILARGIAAHLDRPVRMRSHGLTGARSSDLERQLALAIADEPDIVVILVGANDIRDMVPPWRSAALLGQTVAALTSRSIPVVAGTCPDFGVIPGIPQPLRRMLGTWSLGLAALQERAVHDAGGAAVPLARLVSPQFAGRPDLFAPDHFHPSGAGYGRAMAVLVPAAIVEMDKRMVTGALPGERDSTAHPLSA